MFPAMVTPLLDCEPEDEEKESLTVIIVRKGDKFAGLIVDELNGQQGSKSIFVRMLMTGTISPRRLMIPLK